MSFLQTLAHLLVLRPFVRIFFGLHVVGKENLLGLDRYIIVANHNSHLDVALLFQILPVKHIGRTHPVAAEDYFAKRKILFRLVDCLFRPIWITRGGKTDDSLERMKEQLASGRNIIIFPEGTRGDPGELQRFKSGVGRLVVQYPGVPILPVFLSGPERALPKTTILPLPFWNHVVIGPPQTCARIHREATRSLESAIGELFRAESARRQKRKPRRTASAPSVAFVGIDGSGKSSVSRKAAAELSLAGLACLASDRLQLFERGAPKEMQPLVTEQLRQFIGQRAKRAKSLKLYKIPKLTELLLRNRLLDEAERWYQPGVIVMDGCPLLNMAAWAALYKGKLDEETCAKAIAVLAGQDSHLPKNDPIFARFPELLYLKHLKLNTLKLPDALVFIDTSPAEACRRIAARGEQRQAHETEQNLGELREAYRTVCEVIQRRWAIPTTTLDGGDAFENVAARGMEFIRQSLNPKGADHEPPH